MGGDKLNFDDDDDEAWEAEMKLAKEESLRQARAENDARIQRLRE